jgi:uncharacterized delta-60 repeat protein
MHKLYQISFLILILSFQTIIAIGQSMPGVIFTRFGNTDPIPYSSAIQTDGKIVAAGETVLGSFKVFTLVRYNLNGSLDTSFNGTGIVTTAIGSGNSVIKSVAILPDGKIIAAGTCFNGTNDNFAVARYNTNGSLDTTFNGTGIVITAITNGNNARVYSSSLQPDGKIIVVGEDETVFPNGGISALAAVVRYNSNGSLDTSFNGTGKLTISLSWLIIARAYAITPQSDGKLIVGGNRFLARINSNGSFDTTFNGTGKLLIEIFPYSILQQTDGKILTGGSGGNGFAAARVNNDGSLDTNFGGTGLVSISAGGTGSSVCYSAVFQSDGKIVLSGSRLQSGNIATIVRYNTNGTLDTTFNGTGILNQLISWGNGYSYSVKIQSDNKIVSTGSSFGLSGNNLVFTVARFNSNGSLDTTFNGVATNTKKPSDFDGDGKTDISVFRPSVGEWYYQRSSTLVVNGATFGSSTDKIVPADYTGDGKTDIAIFRPSTGFWFVLRSEDFSFYAFPYGVSTDIPTPGDFDGDGKADAAVFRPSTGIWYISKSSGGDIAQPFGTSGDRPVVADYDGDGKSDIAIFRPSVGEWYALKSGGGVIGAAFGAGTDKTVQGDYTGDGKADFAFYRPSTGFWWVLRSEDFSFYASPFGAATDTPTPGDYDGDGKFDQAVFRPSTGIWYINKSNGSGVLIQPFGASTDIPAPGYYLP